MAVPEPRAAADEERPGPPAKSEHAFRTISEVSDSLDVAQHVLRFWETKFTQIRPLKRGGRRRYYRPEDIALLRGLRALLYEDGYTIRGVQKLLREGGVRVLQERAGGPPPEKAPAAPAPAAPIAEPAPEQRAERAAAEDDPRRAELEAALREIEVMRRILDDAL